MSKYTKEQLQEAYKETLGDISGCCSPFDWGIETVNGICPDCGRATSDGQCVCGCSYSPVICKTCGATPCDCSC